MFCLRCDGGLAGGRRGCEEDDDNEGGGVPRGRRSAGGREATVPGYPGYPPGEGFVVPLP